MPIAHLDHETDFAGWRAAARALRSAGVAPDQVDWTIGAIEPTGVAESGPVFDGPGHDFCVPKAFLDLAQTVICHRAPDRLDRLYRLLWRFRDEPALLTLDFDPDLSEARRMAGEVVRSAHRMKAFLRFDRIAQDPATYTAWFEPRHRVLRRTAPFFAARFGERSFSIHTPDGYASWDGRVLGFHPTVSAR